MLKKAKQYSATEKTKIVIEAIKSEMTVAQISSKNMAFIRHKYMHGKNEV